MTTRSGCSPWLFLPLVLLALSSVSSAQPPQEPAAEEPPAETSQEAAPEAVTTESGLQYLDLEEGMGPEVRKGDRIEVHYVGWLPDRTVFDASRKRGQPFQFRVGRGEVIKGWDEGVVGMKVGGKRRLLVPPELGYGKRGAGRAIPPNSTLLFEIELIGIR